MPNDANEITSLILRFRDLITATGETIESHRAICQAHGNVWWGWWAKAGECVPSHVFMRFNALAKKDGSILIFLVDTGTHTFYKVTCTEIMFSTDTAVISSPQPALTPAYYSTTKPSVPQ